MNHWIHIRITGAIIRGRLRWLGHVLRMKDDRLPKVFLFTSPSKAKRKVGHPRLGLERCHKEKLKGNGNFLGDVKSEALTRLG